MVFLLVVVAGEPASGAVSIKATALLRVAHARTY